MIKCDDCRSTTYWCSDFDAEDYGYEFEGVVGVYSCPSCDTMYQIVSNINTNEDFIIKEDMYE